EQLPLLAHSDQRSRGIAGPVPDDVHAAHLSQRRRHAMTTLWHHAAQPYVAEASGFRGAFPTRCASCCWNSRRSLSWRGRAAPWPQKGALVTLVTPVPVSNCMVAPAMSPELHERGNHAV